MSIHFSDPHLTVYIGDCREVLATLPERSVHTVVTSPPYWGLRDYGTATWEGGEVGCHHSVGGQVEDSKWAGAITTGQRPGVDASVCRKCGARRIDAQLGLEPTPEEYVANMVAVFREVRRVLRDDGTVWLNLGDSYASGGDRGNAGRGATSTLGKGWFGDRFDPAKQPVLREQSRAGAVPGLKPKDLVGIPWRVAFALQADGWYLRSDIIWSKPNPMPESVTDRPTKAHEYVFLLSKSPRYFYDADAVREPHLPVTLARIEKPLHQRHPDNVGVGIPPVNTERMGERFANPSGRNMRSVWSIATQPYPGAHFATFPEALVEPCVKAGCPPDGVVLDPFGGSGTTARVANRLGRRAILIDLSADYIDQAMARNAQAPLGLTGS